MHTIALRLSRSFHPGELFNNPAALLLMAGALLGFNFPLRKVAGEAGISAMTWAIMISLGASLTLFPLLALKRRLKIPSGRVRRYVVISGLVSFVGPNLLLFEAIPHVGAGYAGLMFALSPVFTLTLATLIRLEKTNRKDFIGIGLGLTGAIVVSITRGMSHDSPSLLWLLASLGIPLLLACGNIYRTLDWPDAISPDVLAFWNHAFAMMVFLGLSLAFKDPLTIKQLAHVPWTATAQWVVAGMMFPIFFRLQLKGGPVLLSQSGYVAAEVGLILATLLLDERYAPLTWAGAVVIAMGIAVTVSRIKSKQQGEGQT